MVQYSYENDSFVIEDFQNAKTFASFLPAVAGVDGKPLWAFYCNQGQGLSSFGVTGKDTPITPFDSATLAYQNIALKSFRTFLKWSGKAYTPFLGEAACKRTMRIRASEFSIEEENDAYRMEIVYSTVSHSSFPALLRQVKLTNKTKEKARVEILDGLPVFFPHGLSNVVYKEMVFLMAAYCVVRGNENNQPFVKFKTSTGDNPIVTESKDGHGFAAVDQNGSFLKTIVDPSCVFGSDPSLMTAHPFMDQDGLQFEGQTQQTENKLPCAFVHKEVEIEGEGSYSFAEIYGMWDDEAKFQEALKDFGVQKAEEYRKQTALLLKELEKPAEVHTGYPVFDRYVKQSYLDNGLRGGFPMLLPNGQVYYVYGRKHGDMERDYNAFQMPARYYSSGPGNFRDVNQNRRSDLYFHPYVGDYNIQLFFSLIQMDGQNPLNVKPNVFVLNEDADLSFLNEVPHEKEIRSILKGFEPSTLYTYLRDTVYQNKGDVDVLFHKILCVCHQEAQANFAEGYWVDHWDYNLDLLEAYSSVYPDKEENLFFGTKYPYFYSPIYVEPRSEKYCLNPDGKPRQYGAIDLKAAKDYCDSTGFDMGTTHWLVDENGLRVTSTLAEKIIHLICVKFSTLDSQQIGIEMECEKPGWNDAMNGLPGLFASSIPETVELLRLVRYAKKHFAPFAEKSLSFLPKQAKLFEGLKSNLAAKKNGTMDSFTYWDHVTSLREELRLAYRYHAESNRTLIPMSEALSLLDEMEEILSQGLKEAKAMGKGILPTYLIHNVDRYEKLGRKNHLGFETIRALSFQTVLVPSFLEGPARAFKLHDGTMGEEDYQAIRNSELHDPKLGFYKTSASLEDAPFEIGRVHAFTKGWLERECNFLHMTYKYLLGLLKDERYEDFYQEAKVNFVCFMDPHVYGRDPAEASSFLVPSNNPDSSKWGQGFEARLTGANAEFMEMVVLLFFGEHLFSMENGLLTFHLEPKLSHEFFDEKKQASFLLLGKTKVTYHNPHDLDLYQEGVHFVYQIEGKSYSCVCGELAERIREGKVQEIDVEVLS